MPSLRCERSAILLCGLVLALTNALYAQSAGKQGDEYSLSGARAGDQSVPQISIGPNGGFVVWQDNAIDGVDKSYGIAARKLNADLTPASTVFRVNQVLKNLQENPQVALLKNGAASFVWQGGKLGAQDIFLRTYTAKGTWMPTNDLRVNKYTTGQQSTPGITALTNDNLAVVWCSLHQDKGLEGVYARVVKPTGVMVTGPIQVNQVTGGNQRSPAIAALSNGNFVVTWASENQGVSTLEVFRHTNRVHVYARVFTSAGVAVGNEFRVNTLSNLCAMPAVAPSGATGFTIAWAQRSDNRTNGWDIYARTFSAANTPETDAILVNGVTERDQFAPKIAQVGSDQLIVWTSALDGSREGVFGRFMSAGSASGSEFLVNTHTGASQINPVVNGNKSNQFLVAWSSFMGESTFDIEAQRFVGGLVTSNAPPVGSEGTLGQNTPPNPGTGPQPPPPPTTGGSSGSTLSTLRVTLANTVKGKLLSWSAELGRTYQIQYSTNCIHWQNLGDPRAATAASDFTWVGNGESAGFYRVVRLP